MIEKYRLANEYKNLMISHFLVDTLPGWLFGPPLFRFKIRQPPAVDRQGAVVFSVISAVAEPLGVCSEA
jgi:hypothetical protein